MNYLLSFIGITTAAITVYLICATVIYRMPKTLTPVMFEGEVIYKVITLDKRDFYESLVGGNRMVLINGAGEFYIRASERKKIWPEAPLDMKRKHYSLYARLEAQPLLFGGFSLAKVIVVERLDKPPCIRKS